MNLYFKSGIQTNLQILKQNLKSVGLHSQLKTVYDEIQETAVKTQKS